MWSLKQTFLIQGDYGKSCIGVLRRAVPHLIVAEKFARKNVVAIETNEAKISQYANTYKLRSSDGNDMGVLSSATQSRLIHEMAFVELGDKQEFDLSASYKKI